MDIVINGIINAFINITDDGQVGEFMDPVRIFKISVYEKVFADDAKTFHEFFSRIGVTDHDDMPRNVVCFLEKIRSPDHEQTGDQ